MLDFSDVGSTPTTSTNLSDIIEVFVSVTAVATKTATTGGTSMMSDCLFKRNNTYYFRLTLPQDIAPYISRKEIWKSLKTKNYRVCKDYYIEASMPQSGFFCI